jgi:hypothetical protein
MKTEFVGTGVTERAIERRAHGPGDRLASLGAGREDERPLPRLPTVPLSGANSSAGDCRIDLEALSQEFILGEEIRVDRRDRQTGIPSRRGGTLTTDELEKQDDPEDVDRWRPVTR